MNLTVVFDNNAFDPRLRTGWGFAAWLEYEGHTLLFDTGADGPTLLTNLAALGMDPQVVEAVVLSHMHGDHTGGLASLLAANPEVTVYLPQAFPTQFKEEVRAAGATVVEVTGPVEILPGLWSTGAMGTDIVEQALVARAEDGLVVVTGCAHPGVDDMVARAAEVGQNDIALVVGGFHLGSATQGRVEAIVDAFRRLGVRQVAPCHCTGDAARAIFQQAYGPDYFACGVGWHWGE
jgi:7,8-dihydropterin-6-yl-methyl-4-(beta-D-ribofuranosyl)aminobenzene 5'-phosphate synthase